MNWLQTRQQWLLTTDTESLQASDQLSLDTDLPVETESEFESADSGSVHTAVPKVCSLSLLSGLVCGMVLEVLRDQTHDQSSKFQLLAALL